MRQKPSDLFHLMPWATETVSLSGGVVTPVLRHNPARVGLAFAYSEGAGPATAAQVDVWFNETVTDTVGLRLNSSNPWLILSFRDFGPAICQPWYAVYNQSGGGGSGSLLVYEFDYRPDNWRI